MTMDEATLRRLFDGDPTPACLAGTDGIVRDANQAFASLFAFPDAARALGARLDTLLVDAPAWRRAAERAAAGAPPPRFVLGGRSMDGRSLALGCDLAPAGTAGAIDEVLAWFTDTTELRRLERELVQSPRTLTGSRIVRGIGHDLGNMMMVIRGFAEVLVRELPETGKGRGWLAQIRTAADRAAALGDELLAAARPPDPRPAGIEPAAFLDECLPRARRVAATGVTVEPRVAGDCPAVRIDRQRLEDVLLSLVAAACGSEPAVQRITIELAVPSADRVRLSVGDPASGRSWDAVMSTEGARG